jgi:hypothetical protein
MTRSSAGSALTPFLLATTTTPSLVDLTRPMALTRPCQAMIDLRKMAVTIKYFMEQ